MTYAGGVSVEFGTTGFCPAFQGAEVARESEALGFDVQLFGENHNMAADLFGEMRAAADATSRIRLHCGPVNFVTRDPGVVASAIAPIQIASGGRAICGIARGDSAVALAGRLPQRHADLSRDLDILRAYLKRETVTFGRVRSLDERLAAIQAVTPEDVLRVARTYLVDDQRNVVRVVSPPGSAASEGGR